MKLSIAQHMLQICWQTCWLRRVTAAASDSNSVAPHVVLMWTTAVASSCSNLRWLCSQAGWKRDMDPSTWLHMTVWRRSTLLDFSLQGWENACHDLPVAPPLSTPRQQVPAQQRQQGDPLI
jgi:hypothetical protein